MRLTPEFRFVAAGCIWPPSQRRDRALRDAVTADFNWHLMLRVVARQRVAGLVQDAIRFADMAPPPDVAASLFATAQSTARNGLRFAAQSLSLQRRFDEAGITCLFVKGAPLAMEAYGSVALKHSWDIDLLILPEQVSESVMLLEAMGNRPSHPLPPQDGAHFRRWMTFAREFVFYPPDGGAPVELHWKLLENPHLMPGVTAASPFRTIALADAGQLRTLEHDTLFAYLCAHGAVHGWSRLKWLADVNALIASDDEVRLRERLVSATRMKVGHCAAQAYLLCDRLFATPSLAVIARDLRRNRRYRYLERVALEVLTRGDGARELSEFAFSEFSISCSHFLLGPGPRFMMRELRNKLSRPYDLLYAKPGRLEALYPFLRVASWLGRAGRLRALRGPEKP